MLKSSPSVQSCNSILVGADDGDDVVVGCEGVHELDLAAHVLLCEQLPLGDGLPCELPAGGLLDADVGRAELHLSYLLELGRVDVTLEDGVHKEARTLDAHVLHLGHMLCRRWVVPRLRGGGRLRLVRRSGGVLQFGDGDGLGSLVGGGGGGRRKGRGRRGGELHGPPEVDGGEESTAAHRAGTYVGVARHRRGRYADAHELGGFGSYGAERRNVGEARERGGEGGVR
jgi:hypothetical protein